MEKKATKSYEPRTYEIKQGPCTRVHQQMRDDLLETFRLVKEDQAAKGVSVPVAAVMPTKLAEEVTFSEAVMEIKMIAKRVTKELENSASSGGKHQ